MILFGRNIFKEALSARASILEVYVETKSAYEWIQKSAGSAFSSFKIQEGLPSVVQKENHQGIAFKTNHPFYKVYDAQEMRKNRSIVLCNHVEDVHNLGSITRCAAAFGSTLIIHEEEKSSSVTASVVKSSAGCAFRVSFMKVDSLEIPLKTLSKSEYQIFGLDVSSQTKDLYEASILPGGRRAFVLDPRDLELKRAIKGIVASF